MSLVFEALKRASEEKKGTVETPKGPRGVSDDEISRRSQAPEASSLASVAERISWPGPGANENSGSTLLVQRGDELRPNSWRERLENILFGWSIGRFTSHPIVALEKDSPAAEQYKILREQVKKLRADTGARCLAVTSPIKSDGKTMVAANLAAAMALDYEGKILLIDCDLRRPEVHRYFGIQPSPGLGDYLSSSANGNLMSYVRDTSIPGFQIFPGGQSSHFSSELLAKEKMKILMQEIRTRFPEHQIILDAPPVLSTPDPLVLGKHVDGIIVVVRAGKTPRDCLSKTVQTLNPAKVLGIVLNGVELGISSKYYYYYNKDSNFSAAV